MILGALLWLQIVQGIPAVIEPVDSNLTVVMNEVAYPIQLGDDCDWLTPDQEVEVMPGTGGMAVLTSDDLFCHVFIGES